MAQDNFYGEWQMRDTSGTPFGLGTTITIGENTEGTIEFVLVPPVEDSEIEAKYNEGLDALEITGIYNTEIMYVSRYVDERYGFYSIYGAAFMQEPPRTAVFMASATSTPSEGPVAGRAIDSNDFDAKYKVGTTTGAQFGKRSTVEISGGGNSIDITNVSGEPIRTPDVMVFDEAVCALTGDLPESDQPPVRIQISLAPRETRKHAYGLSVVGDPEEAGAWESGEEDPTPEPLEPEALKG